MNRIILFIGCILCLFFFFRSGVLAIYDPLSVPNNKYGIHIIDENDLDNASALVNSSGGDWGYATIVIAKNDRNPDKWVNILERMRELHLVPIIRLATVLHGDTWEKPVLDDADIWADFLDKLPWVSKNRYVVIFNEPNHAKEWGGEINAYEYAQILSKYSVALKNKSVDFFILPAGLDSSAPNSQLTLDQATYIRNMLVYNPNIFDFIDGWTSHSYPNPGFKGKVKDRGRGTIANYLWELNLLKNLKINKKLRVFITETGWPHREGLLQNQQYYPASDIANFIFQTATSVWKDENIVAVTPFVLNYPTFPFAQFSWQNQNTRDFYPQYFAYQAIAKINGQPILTDQYLQIKGVQTEITPSQIPNTKKDYIHNSVWELLAIPTKLLTDLFKPLLRLIHSTAPNSVISIAK